MVSEKRSVEGQVAFVTGAGQGIGEGIAARLHSDGFKVVVADINKENADKVADSLGGKAAGVVALKVDVADRDSVHDAIDETVEIFGDLHVVANNAGIVPMSPIDEITSDEFATAFAVNTGGALWGIQAGAKAFEKLGHGGKIISAASQAGHVGNLGIPVYSATKFAIRGLTQSAARELAPKGITVNAWAPGSVRTALMEPVLEAQAEATGQSKDWVADQIAERIPLRKLSSIEDVANVVSFLSGPDSDYITGQSIIVDGGVVFTGGLS